MEEKEEIKSYNELIKSIKSIDEIMNLKNTGTMEIKENIIDYLMEKRQNLVKEIKENNYIDFFKKSLQKITLEKLKEIIGDNDLTFDSNIVNEFGHKVNVGSEIKEYIDVMGDDLLIDLNIVEDKIDEWFFEYKLNEDTYNKDIKLADDKKQKIEKLEEELNSIEKNVLEKLENFTTIHTSLKTQFINIIIDKFNSLKEKINNTISNLLQNNTNITKDTNLKLTNEMKFELVKSSSVSSKILDTLAKDTDISILRKIASHPNTETNTLIYIANNTEDFKVLENLLNNENTPTDVIDKLSKNNDRDISLKALEHSNISKKTLEKYSKMTDIEVISSILKNKNCPLKALENIVASNSTNKEVLKNVFNHKNCLDDLKDVIKDISIKEKKSSLKDKINCKKEITNQNTKNINKTYDKNITK